MDITLPYDTSLEDTILGSVILDPNTHNTIAPYITDIEVFYQMKARLLWNKIKEMRFKKELIDTRTVSMSLTQHDINRGLTHYYVVGCTGDTCL